MEEFPESGQGLVGGDDQGPPLQVTVVDDGNVSGGLRQLGGEVERGSALGELLWKGL